MKELYSYMDFFFKKNGNNHNYEPIIDKFLNKNLIVMNYKTCSELSWININYEEDYNKAQKEIYKEIYE